MSYPYLLQLLRNTHPGWVLEHRFHPVRRWRFDAALPCKMLALEIDGGVWTGGRHSRGAGQIADMAKGNEACALGWSVLHFTPQQLKSGEMIRFINYVLTRKIA